MRLIDADEFKENILSGLYIFCQENKEDIAQAIDSEPTVDCSNELSEMTFSHVLTTEERQDLTRAFLIGKRSEQRPQGEWIDYNNTFYKCPECGYLLEKCCPQCQNKVILPKGGTE